MEKFNVICVLWMICYYFRCLLTHLHTGILLVHSGIFEFLPPSWDTRITLDLFIWNGAIGELSSCVINNILLDYLLTFT